MARLLMPAAIGKEEAGRCKLPAGHGNRTMVDIDAQHLLGCVNKVTVRAHVMRERKVAVGNSTLGLDYLVIDDDGVIVRQESDEAEDMADGFARFVTG